MYRWADYQSHTLKLMRQRYRPGTAEYIEITRLIGLAQYREKHGPEAYAQLVKGLKERQHEVLNNQYQLSIFDIYS